MTATVDDLDFIAPAICCLAKDEKERALRFACAYRPECLDDDRQDEAQLLYAAWLLYNRMQQKRTDVPAQPHNVKSIKEGDVTYTWGNSDEGGNGVVSDPMGFYARWKTLNDMCARLGAITVGVRRGYCSGC